MKGKNGWVYGRGVSDNKGPMLAIAAAAADLRAAQMLEIDLVMVVEGEEETGSAGFQDAIKENLVSLQSSCGGPCADTVLQDVIGDIDVILVSNSYWIGEDIPCLTFGLRGVIHATIGVSLPIPSLRPPR